MQQFINKRHAILSDYHELFSPHAIRYIGAGAAVTTCSKNLIFANENRKVIIIVIDSNKIFFKGNLVSVYDRQANSSGKWQSSAARLNDEPNRVRLIVVESDGIWLHLIKTSPPVT